MLNLRLAWGLVREDCLARFGAQGGDLFDRARERAKKYPARLVRGDEMCIRDSLTVHEGVGETAHVAGGHPHLGVHQNGGVHAHVVGCLLYTSRCV